MAPNSIQGQSNLLFNSFNSDIFPGVSDLFTQTSISSIQYPKSKQTKYFTAGNTTVKLNSPEKDLFSILYLNRRSLNKKFESLKTFLAEFGF